MQWALAQRSDTQRFWASAARAGLSPPQRALLVALLAGVAALLLLAEAPVSWLMMLAGALFLLVIGVQVGAAIESTSVPSLSTGERADDHRSDRAWPAYSVLVPLHREAPVARQLVEAMRRLDYPEESLDILFLVEADDPETAAALWAAGPPASARIVTVPPGHPRTKPRALNHGLALAAGVYVTVFDAEDIPEPDQLKRAVRLFERAPGQVRCLQARLAIDNLADGWLPLMSGIEYAALFDSIKCGLARAAMPVALGGTSNHFRRADLLALGGWDAWNVAEDADLGLRIARSGGLVLDLPSTTWEEAPVTLGGWFGQRRRWFKGWMQTGISHAREPRAAIRSMGATGWLVAQLEIVGLVFSALTFPFFSVGLAWSLITGELWEVGTPLAFAANTLALVVLMMGGLAMLLPALIGLKRRGLWPLAPWLATLPFYLVLVSAAAWMALWDLQRRPFHWAKTEHGLGRRMTLVRSRR
jgi:cellulose synthase/poly-beta-1,6-N-acetylglucosamine synthase-like glycosyltransferase